MKHEQDHGDGADDRRAEHLPRAPGIRRPAPVAGEQDARDPERQHRRAQVVDRVLARAPARAHRAHDDDQRERAQRQVDEEDPAPRRGVGQRAAEQRAGHRGGRPRGADVALVLAALARREEVGDRGLAQRNQAARAHALQRPEGDQLAHRLRRPAERGPEQEDRDRDDEEPPPPVEVAQLAVERDGHRGREQVRGDDPREVLEPVQVGDDVRQRGRDDRLVERGEQRREHDRRERDENLTLGACFGGHRTNTLAAARGRTSHLVFASWGLRMYK